MSSFFVSKLYTCFGFSGWTKVPSKVENVAIKCKQLHVYGRASLLLFLLWGIQNKDKISSTGWNCFVSEAVSEADFVHQIVCCKRPVIKRREFLCFKSNLCHEIGWNTNFISFLCLFFFCCFQIYKAKRKSHFLVWTISQSGAPLWIHHWVLHIPDYLPIYTALVVVWTHQPINRHPVHRLVNLNINSWPGKNTYGVNLYTPMIIAGLGGLVYFDRLANATAIKWTQYYFFP